MLAMVMMMTMTVEITTGLLVLTEMEVVMVTFAVLRARHTTSYELLITWQVLTVCLVL